MSKWGIFKIIVAILLAGSIVMNIVMSNFTSVTLIHICALVSIVVTEVNEWVKDLEDL